MNLQLATANPVAPHAASPKVAASAAGSHPAPINGGAPDTIDFATLLAQSLPSAATTPGRETTTAAPMVKEEKTVVADPASINPGIAADPGACPVAAHAPTAIDAISTASAQADFSTAERLHSTLSATQAIALALPTAPATTKSASTLSTADPAAPHIDDAPRTGQALPIAAQFPAAPAAVAGAAEIRAHPAIDNVGSLPAQAERGAQDIVVPPPMNAAPAAPPRLEIETPLATAGWDQQLGQRVLWMSNQHVQVAELHINPPDLGPLEMRLTLDQGGQQANLQFSSPHAAVRETIESAMPRLREMMADAGIALGNATVSGESLPRQAAPDYNRSAPQAFAEAPPRESDPGESPRSSARVGNGLVDTFA